MWYNISSKKLNNTHKKWFEQVPDNIWNLTGTEYSISKSLDIEDNLPFNFFIVKKNNKEISKGKTIEEAFEIAEKNYAENLPKKDN